MQTAERSVPQVQLFQAEVTLLCQHRQRAIKLHIIQMAAALLHFHKVLRLIASDGQQAAEPYRRATDAEQALLRRATPPSMQYGKTALLHRSRLRSFQEAVILFWAGQHHQAQQPLLRYRVQRLILTAT